MLPPAPASPQSRNDDTPQSDTHDSRRVLFIAVAILVCEYLALSFAFDAQPLLASGGFGWLAGRFGTAAPLLIVLPTALIVVHASSGQRGTTLGFRLTPTTQRRWWLLAHVLTFVAFVRITDALFVPGRHSPSGVSLLVWAGLGASASIALLASAVSLASLAPARIVRVGGLVLAIGLLAWAGGLATASLWEPLSRGTLELVALLLAVVLPDVVTDPQTLAVGTERFWVTVAPVCSGFEGIGLMLVLLGAYVWLARAQLRFPRVLVLFPLAALAMWLLNGVRIAALIAVGTWWSPDVALGGFHSKAGWLLFCALALALVALLQRNRWFRRDVPNTLGDNPTATHLLPLLTMVGTSMLTQLFSTDVVGSFAVVAIATSLAIVGCRDALLRTFVGVPLTPVAVGIGLGLLWVFTDPARNTIVQVPGSTGGLYLRAVGTVLLTPVVEELAFRGYALRRFVRREFQDVSPECAGWLAIFASSAAFGILHERWIAAMACGIVFALLYRRRGKLGDAIACHAATNAILVGYAIVTGAWQVWLPAAPT